MSKPEILKERLGAVSCTWEIAIPFAEAEEQEAELRAALAVVQRYEKLAMRMARVKHKNADWTMVKMAVKNDKVLVTVQQGMCG